MSVRVMVTGGTGFVGAYSVAALLEAGHEVRLLVRSEMRIREVLDPLGIPPTDFVLGDMTDPVAVGEAMEGCDAVLHAAAVVALDKRRAAEILEANPKGARVVLGAAAERGLDPIVHVSSLSAINTPGIPMLHRELPPARTPGAYGQSKAECETYARALQAEGVPVAITYPSGVTGPNAGPAFGEMAEGIIAQVKPGFLPLRKAAISIIDVRDLALVHTALMEAGKGPRRFVCGGPRLTMDDLATILRRLTGKRFPVAPVPASFYRSLGRAVDAASRLTPIDTVFTHEAMLTLTTWPHTDDAGMTEVLGVTPRDPEESLRDAILALHRAGKLTDRQVGKLAM